MLLNDVFQQLQGLTMGIEPMVGLMYMVIVSVFAFIFGLQVGEKWANRYVYQHERVDLDTVVDIHQPDLRPFVVPHGKIPVPVSYPRIHIQPWGEEKFNRKLDYWEQQLNA